MPMPMQRKDDAYDDDDFTVTTMANCDVDRLDSIAGDNDDDADAGDDEADDGDDNKP